jgi:hypothetical protein
MILFVVYRNLPFMSEQDHAVEVINDIAERIVRAGYVGAHLVEFFPWMRHVHVPRK